MNERLATTYREVIARFAYLPRTMRLIWPATRGWTVAWMAVLILQGVMPAATVFLTRPLVNSLSAAVAAHGAWEQIQPVLALSAIMAAILVLTELLQAASGWIRNIQSELTRDHVSALIHAKSISVDLAFYDSAEDYDRLHRARDDASVRPLDLLESLGSLMQNGVTLLAMATVLIPYGLWLPFLLILSTLPALIVVLRSQLHYHNWWKHSTPERRRAEYYDQFLTSGEVAAEMRLFDLGHPFGQAYQEQRRHLREEHLRLTRESTLAQLGARLCAVVIAGAAIVWMGWRMLSGQVTLGDVVLFYQAFNQGQSLIRSLLNDVGYIYKDGLFLSNLFEFLDLKPNIVGPEKPISVSTSHTYSVRFRQVTFQYPASQRPALQNFDISIPAGQLVAIVGANGAGKSTFSKLLCRFYDPDSGSIELDGIDIRNLAIADLRQLITVLFQMPVRYQATAGQNIALGDLSREHGIDATIAAARGAGADAVIERLPQRYDTPLGKWFAGGTELSGGEWQRIALARAFLRQSPIVILDEPTSFMDSWAEAEWLDRFRSLVERRTALIITHRFTTAMRADIIHVMDHGQIVESGTHEQLLAHGGLYAQSWQAQMRASTGVIDLSSRNYAPLEAV